MAKEKMHMIWYIFNFIQLYGDINYPLKLSDYHIYIITHHTLNLHKIVSHKESSAYCLFKQSETFRALLWATTIRLWFNNPSFASTVTMISRFSITRTLTIKQWLAALLIHRKFATAIVPAEWLRAHRLNIYTTSVLMLVTNHFYFVLHSSLCSWLTVF